MKSGAPSFLMRVTSCVARFAFRSNARPDQIQYQALVSRSKPRHSEPSRKLKRGCEISKSADNFGSITYTLKPKKNRSDSQIIYIHGGAYVHELMSVHWDIIWQLMKQTGATVTVPLYPLAPENEFPAAFSMIESIYLDLLKNHGAHKILLCGDSAGGGLAVAICQQLLKRGVRLPDCLVLFSPWLDVTMSNPESYAIEPEDPILNISALKMCGRLWAGRCDIKIPQVSPFFGVTAGLPPMVIFQGTKDVFLPTTIEFASRAKDSGTRVALFVYEGAFHVFNAVTFLPESKDVYSKIRKLFG